MSDNRSGRFSNFLDATHSGITVGIDEIKTPRDKDIGEIMKPNSNCERQQK
jgi:hypothetical protein